MTTAFRAARAARIGGSRLRGSAPQVDPVRDTPTAPVDYAAISATYGANANEGAAEPPQSPAATSSALRPARSG